MNDDSRVKKGPSFIMVPIRVFFVIIKTNISNQSVTSIA